MKNFKNYIKEDFNKKINDPYNEEIDEDDINIKKKEASDIFDKMFDIDPFETPDEQLYGIDDDYIDEDIDEDDEDIELKLLDEYTEIIVYKTVKFDKFPEHEILYKITYDDDGFAFVDIVDEHLPNNIMIYLAKNEDSIRDILLKR